MNDRKHQVLLSAKQIFLEKGFVETSVQDILEKAKISKGTFYNYFTSKNECIMAILENGRGETIMRRQELLIGQCISNKKVLATQITIRLQVNQEHNLVPIFEAIFHSGDAELRSFAKKHHFSELSWLSKRLIDVYGEKAKPVALDCATLMTGMIQHTIHVWSTCSTQNIDMMKLVTFIMRRIDSIIYDMMEADDLFLGQSISTFLNDQIEQSTVTKKQLCLLLNNFREVIEKDTEPANKQYTQFLLDEIETVRPRIFLLETITRSFRKSFINTPYQQDAHELAAHVWKYTEILKQSTK